MDKNTFASLSNYIDLLLDAICVVDKEGRFMFVSAGAERIFGYTPAEMIGQPMIEMVHPDDRQKTLQTVEEIMAGVLKVDFENRYLRKDGKVVHLLWSARWSEADKMRVAVARDISKSKRAEAMQVALFDISEAAHTEESLLSLYQRIHQIVADLMPAKQFAIALYEPKSGTVSFPYKTLESTTDAAMQQFDATALCADVIHNGKTRLIPGAASVDSSPNWLGVPLKSQNGIIGALMVQTYEPDQLYTFNDQELLEFVSTQIAAAIERKLMLDRLQHLALYDQLTGLPNRELFHDRVQQALARARRQQQQLALFYLDLDKFKQVNDTLGHAVGDKLLQEAARRISLCVRESDTVVRFGGDEFVILLDRIAKQQTALVVAEKIRTELSQPFELDGNVIDMSASIGIALFPANGDSEQQLLLYADEAMYFAKRRGGNQFQG
ncbi:GGDEF domain-containing protein [Methylophaga sp. OBS4]|uniref:GGDEF domain-containing protein n=1 Tax=Methylophaga sp. OBS4 TaxID=2991935 RepID=UPI00225064DA|nr:GGDEF domain-containing protein [Methylophaga sp. OBS4]MCX4187703.1 diguanylate cyclase [Methylophaga sp. OBS4]